MAPERDDEPRADATEAVLLEDGRTLADAAHGDPDGTPVVFCHGTPGSRLSGALGRGAQADARASPARCRTPTSRCTRTPATSGRS